MTWGEFKAVVECQGVRDDSEMWYIDVTLLDQVPCVSVETHEGLGVSID